MKYVLKMIANPSLGFAQLLTIEQNKYIQIKYYVQECSFSQVCLTKPPTFEDHSYCLDCCFASCFTLCFQCLAPAHRRCGGKVPSTLSSNITPA